MSFNFITFCGLATNDLWLRYCCYNWCLILFLKEPRLHQFFNDKCKIAHVFSSIQFAFFPQSSWPFVICQVPRVKNHHKLTKIHKFIQKSHKFYVMVNMNEIICIQYFKYSNGWNIFFKKHMWMFMFNTQTTYNFMQNYSTIIAWI